MGNPDRLGRSGPCLTPQCPDKVSVVNVSTKIIWEMKGPNAWTCDPTGHQYFRNNARVRQDTCEVLGGKLDDDFLRDKERRRNDSGTFWRLEQGGFSLLRGGAALAQGGVADGRPQAGLAALGGRQVRLLQD